MCLDRHVGNSKRYLDYIIHEYYEYAEATGNYFDFDAINSPDIFLNFSEEENGLASKELQRIQVQGDFVCVHARDGTFYPNIIRYDANRNTPFENFLPACNNLGEDGIYTLRMGSKQIPVNKEIFNQHIIDYSGKYRTDFMDIWLIANCKFFLGNNSGLFYISYLFCKPSAIVNYPCFLESVPFGVNDIYTPQRLWDKSRKRFLTFKEIAEYDIGLDCWNKVRFDKEGFECIKSAPEEITDLTKEMNDVLDGKYQYNDEDNYLQQKFKSIFKVYHAPYHTPARVGREFLKQNKELFL